MSDKVTSLDDLPLVCHKREFSAAMNKSERTFERLRRAGHLPDPLPIPGRPSWSREVVVACISGNGRGKRRQHRIMRDIAKGYRNNQAHRAQVR